MDGVAVYASPIRNRRGKLLSTFDEWSKIGLVKRARRKQRPAFFVMFIFWLSRLPRYARCVTLRPVFQLCIAAVARRLNVYCGDTKGTSCREVVVCCRRLAILKVEIRCVDMKSTAAVGTIASLEDISLGLVNPSLLPLNVVPPVLAS